MKNDHRPANAVIAKIIRQMLAEFNISQSEIAKNANVARSSLNEALTGTRKKDCGDVFIPVLRALDYDPTIAALIASCDEPDFDLAYNLEFIVNGGELWWDVAKTFNDQPSKQAISAFCTWCKEYLRSWPTLKYLDMFVIDELRHKVRFAEHLSTLTPANG